MNYAAGIAGLYLMKDQKRLSRNPDVDHRLLAAGPEAPNPGQVEVRATVIDGVDQGAIQSLRPVTVSAGSHPHCDSRDRGQQLAHAGFADGIEDSDVLDARHHSLSRSSARTSRCRVRSFTCPQMR